jgi:hypothetical protein
MLAYFHHVQTYYVKDGRPTSEQDNIRQALRFIRTLHGTTTASAFGPMALKNVRQAMIDAGRCRKLINKDINRIRQMFGWAVENEMLPVTVSQALREVKGLRKGRSAARESEQARQPARQGAHCGLGRSAHGANPYRRYNLMCDDPGSETLWKLTM